MKIKMVKNRFAIEFELIPKTKLDKKLLKEFCCSYGRMVFLPESQPDEESIELGGGITFKTTIHPREVGMCDIFDYSGSGAC